MTSCPEEKPPAYKNFDKSNIKCVLVGDSMVGKTCLAKRLANHSFSADYTPTTFDNYAGELCGIAVCLVLCFVLIARLAWFLHGRNKY